MPPYRFIRNVSSKTQCTHHCVWPPCLTNRSPLGGSEQALCVPHFSIHKIRNGLFQPNPHAHMWRYDGRFSSYPVHTSLQLPAAPQRSKNADGCPHHLARSCSLFLATPFCRRVTQKTNFFVWTLLRSGEFRGLLGTSSSKTAFPFASFRYITSRYYPKLQSCLSAI